MSGIRRGPEKLSAKQLTLIRLLCEGLSIEKASKAAGVANSTARIWLALPSVRLALDTAKGEIFTTAIGELKTAALVAGRRLVALLDSKNENVVRLAATEILEINFRIKEETEIEVRLARIEKIIKERRGGK